MRAGGALICWECVRGRVRGCVRAWVRACVRGCVRGWVRGWVGACVRACVRACVPTCVRACVRACACVLIRPHRRRGARAAQPAAELEDRIDGDFEIDGQEGQVNSRAAGKAAQASG